MALFKRSKDRPSAEPQHDPRSEFAVRPLPRHAGPPASSTPLADQLSRGGPGVTEGYVVLPRGLAEQMPLPWQQQAASVLAQFHHTHRQLAWPTYRVLPSREERLVDLDEEQLAEAGYVVEMDVNGELVYRERSGRKVPDPQRKTVLVTCLDPVQPGRPAAPAAEAGPAGPPREPVPMNIGPEPKWDVVPSKAHPAPPPEPQAATPPEPQVSADEDTPPRGIPAPEEAAEPESSDWFVEGGEQEAAFGPSGEPIERPYRFNK